MERGYLQGRIERFLLRDLVAAEAAARRRQRAASRPRSSAHRSWAALLATAAVAANRPLLGAHDALVLWLYFAIAAVRRCSCSICSRRPSPRAARRAARRPRHGDALPSGWGRRPLAYLVLLWVRRRARSARRATWRSSPERSPSPRSWPGSAGSSRSPASSGATGEVPDREAPSAAIALRRRRSLAALFGARATSRPETRPLRRLRSSSREGASRSLRRRDRRAGRRAGRGARAGRRGRGAPRAARGGRGLSAAPRGGTGAAARPGPRSRRGCPTRRTVCGGAGAPARARRRHAAAPRRVRPVEHRGASALAHAHRARQRGRAPRARRCGRSPRFARSCGLRRLVGLVARARGPEGDPARGYVVSDRVLAKLLRGRRRSGHGAGRALRAARAGVSGRSSALAEHVRRAFLDVRRACAPRVGVVPHRCVRVEDDDPLLEDPSVASSFTYLPGLDILRTRLKHGRDLRGDGVDVRALAGRRGVRAISPGENRSASCSSPIPAGPSSPGAEGFIAVIGGGAPFRGAWGPSFRTSTPPPSSCVWPGSPRAARWEAPSPTGCFEPGGGREAPRYCELGPARASRTRPRFRLRSRYGLTAQEPRLLR